MTTPSGNVSFAGAIPTQMRLPSREGKQVLIIVIFPPIPDDIINQVNNLKTKIGSNRPYSFKTLALL